MVANAGLLYLRFKLGKRALTATISQPSLAPVVQSDSGHQLG